MDASCRDRIEEETVRKSVNALLRWKKMKKKSNSQSDLGEQHQQDEDEEEEEEEEGDDFIYLSVTLKKPPHKTHTLAPHRIPLRHPLLSLHRSAAPSLCLIVDGKRITSQSARSALPFVERVLKLSKLKSDYKSFESKKKLFDSFDVFLAAKDVVPLLPTVLSKIFYKKKKKLPVPVELNGDGGNWKEEVEKAINSSLLCLSSGTCSAVRVGKLGVNESEEIVENVFEAIYGVVRVVPKKWGGIKCLHLKFSDSLALPVYENRDLLQRDGGKLGGGGFALAGKKRRRDEFGGGRKKMVG